MRLFDLAYNLHYTMFVLTFICNARQIEYMRDESWHGKCLLFAYSLHLHITYIFDSVHLYYIQSYVLYSTISTLANRLANLFATI